MPWPTVSHTGYTTASCSRLANKGFYSAVKAVSVRARLRWNWSRVVMVWWQTMPRCLPGSEQVYAVCPPLLADMLEVYALGIFNLGKLFGPKATTALMPLHLVIELVETVTATPQQCLQPFTGRTNILGVAIPYMQIPVNYPVNLALLVETVTKNHVLYKEGYDASDILIQRQQQLLNQQTV